MATSKKKDAGQPENAASEEKPLLPADTPVAASAAKPVAAPKPLPADVQERPEPPAEEKEAVGNGAQYLGGQIQQGASQGAAQGSTQGAGAGWPAMPAPGAPTLPVITCLVPICHISTLLTCEPVAPQVESATPTPDENLAPGEETGPGKETGPGEETERVLPPETLLTPPTCIVSCHGQICPPGPAVSIASLCDVVTCACPPGGHLTLTYPPTCVVSCHGHLCPPTNMPGCPNTSTCPPGNALGMAQAMPPTTLGFNCLPVGAVQAQAQVGPIGYTGWHYCTLVTCPVTYMPFCAHTIRCPTVVVC